MNTPVEQSEPEISLGEKLRHAREALNLSLEDVTKEIALRPSILQQLENNEFIQESVSPIFVKGYVRSYAKFLRLPESEWQQVSFGETQKNDLDKNVRSARFVNPYSSHTRWIGLLTTIILLIALGMTGLWWWQNYQKSNQERDKLVQTYIEKKGAMLATGDGTKVPAVISSASTNKKEVMEAKAVLISKDSSKSPTVLTAPKSNEKPVVEASIVSDKSQNATTQPIVVASATVSNQQHLVDSTNTPVVPALPKGNLVIEVKNNSSWISVKDKNNKVLTQKEYKQGEVLTFDGDDYSVVIGAPSNVQVIYKGKEYPLRSDGRIEKFTLPKL